LSELEDLAAKRMRMLRLGEGWSAEKLSQEYKKGGAGSLTRTTIAKIESAKRQIKPGEVERVARVFGLTSAALLDPDGQRVFLSYADQDRDAGLDVAEWLSSHGFLVIPAGRPALGPAGSGSEERYAIDTADAYIALLSPDFLSSPRCREELEFAVLRKQQLMAGGYAADYIYVLRVAGTSDLDDSELLPYSPIDLPRAGAREKEMALSKIGGKIILGLRTPGARTEPQIQGQPGPASLDRGEELEQVFYNLNDPAGSHFWLVTSPPGLGKSTFLEQLTRKVTESQVMTCPGPIDLRLEAAADRHDALQIVTKLFGIKQSQPSGPKACLVSAAQKIAATGRPWLCLLDSAEVLPADVVTGLRQYLGEIQRLVQDRGSGNARLGFVVASQNDDRWTGLWPPPRLTVLRLGGFRTNAIQNALEGLAAHMGIKRSPAELREDAAMIHRVTEGVPELVEQSLHWIQAQDWFAIERLDSTELFRERVSPYVRDRLLAPDSLLAGVARPERSAQRLNALEDALRALVPYRFFTLSHVTEHHDADHSFREAVQDADWKIDDLWVAIVGMALLYRQPDEPSHEIHPALRRLLFRHFYPAPEERARAHQDAQDFNRKWAAKQSGTEQIVVMVESIWHEAARLRLSSPAMMEKDLPAFAETLSGDVHESPPYTDAELRNYAVQRMINDDELQGEVADLRLFEKLVRIVLAPKP